ncbi:probable D-lactate dehydrogenase, mitochondrial [Melopsittacus undulatus]|uniref:probable D-lactate dehydrogenase, mitochondrial n=1 Tax=Melopsittacus undulatus TaxID=13146 RepID=UPI00146C3A1C|nr:probable D-lactate dehydrogenase, mitochondrial [Melopsittacus undulatus]
MQYGGRDIQEERGRAMGRLWREVGGSGAPVPSCPPPDAMVWPHAVGQVQELAVHCYCCCVPMVPFGIGTGAAGAACAQPLCAPWQSGICFDLTCIDAMELSLEDFLVAVEPGVTCKALNSHLQGTGLWFPVDPGENASLRGMTATGTSGTNMVCFGTMHPNVLNLHVVLSDRCLLHTADARCQPRKRVAGYDLTSLFMGSRGTLGFLTQAMLHLHPLLEASAATAFPSIQAVMDCTVQVLQTIALVAHIEFLDELMVSTCSRFNSMELPVVLMLFLELHGSWHSLAK